MGFFKKIRQLLVPGSNRLDPAFWIFVRCNRCGEALTTRIHLRNDVSLMDDGTYLSRKVLIGKQRCFQQIEVLLYFNKRRDLLDKQITGGQFITAAEYEAILNPPPPDPPTEDVEDEAETTES